MKLYNKFLFLIFILTLTAVFIWGVYLSQISSDAEVFFYDRTAEEQLELDLKVANRINGDYEKIELVDDKDITTCIFTTDLSLFDSIGSCGDVDDLSEMIESNRYLLDRYISAKVDSSINLSSQSNVNATRLFLIDIYLKLHSGHPNLSMSDWLKSFTYWNAKTRDTYDIDSFVGLALHHVIISHQLELLHQLLASDYTFQQNLYRKTFQALKNIEKKSLPVEDFFKLEFELDKVYPFFVDKKENPFSSLLQGRYLNKYYLYIQELVEYKSFSYIENCAGKESYEIQKKAELSSLERLLRYGPLGYKEFWHMHKITRELIDSIDMLNARRALLRLLIKIKEENIPRSKIKDYIKSHSEIAINPLTEKLFKFDENENALLLDGMGCGTHTEKYHLSNSQGKKSPITSR